MSGKSAARALFECLRRFRARVKTRMSDKKVQTEEDGTYSMQTDFFERLDAISQESREKLNEQIERVQEEARKLRAQARRLRRAQQAEKKQRKRLLEQVARSSKAWGQGMLERGGELTSAAGSQLKVGQQKLAERGSQTTQNLASWGDETTHRLRKQGKHLTQNAADWRDETTHRLRKQGQHLVENVADWGEETAHRLRKQGEHLVDNLDERREEVARKLHKQSRSMSRKLAKQREEMARKLRKQSRALGRNMADRKEDVTRQLRRQSKALSKQRDRLLEPGRRRGGKVWSIFGFIAGLLLAGGVTYWLVRRGLGRNAPEEEQIELPQRDTLNGTSTPSGGEFRYARQGGTAVATRPGATSTESATKFVGVLSTRRYYPIEQQPEATDLVFFASEADALAEGFTAAD